MITNMKKTDKKINYDLIAIVLVLSIIWSITLSGDMLISTCTHFSSLVGISRVASWESSREVGMKWPLRLSSLFCSTARLPCSRTNTISGIGSLSLDMHPFTKMSLYDFLRAEQVTTPEFPSLDSLGGKYHNLCHDIF